LAKAKAYTFNAVLAVVCIGIPVFGALCLYPVVTRSDAEVAELHKAQETLSRWLRKTTLPTETLIEAARNYKAGLQADYERVRSYYEGRNAMLNRGLLDTYTGDPVRVKLKYEELKGQLAAKARYDSTKALSNLPFMPPYAWDAAGKVPSPQDLRLVEKKACIADAVVALLANNPCAVAQIAVGEPAGAADETGGAAEAGTPAARFDRWPVTVDLVARFRQLAVVLDRVVASPAAFPCFVLRGLSFDAAADGQVKAKLYLEVLELK
jgi:hypothetical protein